MLQSKPNHKTLPALVLIFLSLWLAPLAARAAAPPLPVLNWQQRSDWINVKTDVKPAAVGDGVHDDTAAIQAGLNRLSRGYFGSKTLFLPAGTYRITKTLTLDNLLGALIVGTGRTTRILWGGTRGQVMFLSDGVSCCRYIGLTWDGANTAGIGIDHRPRRSYETCVRHQDEAFLNFTMAGIRMGYNYILPTSEVTYRNCLFQNCNNGVAMISWNDYNNNFDGCEFLDNGTAINCSKGTVCARDCHFERSRVLDIFLCSENHSVRRCTSVGSKQFIFVGQANAGCPVTVEDCHVDGWTGSQGAMTFGMYGPETIFDCSFTHSPDAKAPVRLTNDGGFRQLVITSNNSAPAAPAVVSLGQNGYMSSLPAGAHGPSLGDPARSFFKSTEAIPTKTLDVRTDFGAKGDGYTDDTAAILKALSAARTQGGNVVVYFPEGMYNVSGTLPITGSNYTVEGCGYATAIQWVGAARDAVFSVQDPQGVALKEMVIVAPPSMACIRQVNAGAASARMTYERIWLNGDPRGLECVALSPATVVLLDDVYGSTHFTDCSEATILGDFMSGGVMRVDGPHSDKTGFLGVLTHNDANTTCDVIVSDNQDLVGTNFYTEQTQTALRVSGDGVRLGRPGHVTIQGARLHTVNPTPIWVNDYEGRVAYTSVGLESQTGAPSTIIQTGARPVDLMLLGDGFTGLPVFSLDTGARLMLLENFAAPAPNTDLLVVPDCLPGLSLTAAVSLLSSGSLIPMAAQAPLAPAVAALDDFRLLGEYDLALNYP